MRIISLDLGEKSLGVCISDKTNTIAVPIKNYFFEHNNFYQALQIVQNLIKDYPDIDTILLGYPLNLKGEKTKITKIIENFKELLTENLNKIKIIYFDERFTTKYAEEILLKKYTNAEKKLLKDVASAYLMLEIYLSNL